MLFRIAAINHFAPLCRTELLNWLERLRREDGQPIFIAVEWSQEIFQQVLAQRDRFRQLLRQQWPEMSEGVREALVLSLAYEGDTHREVFPDTEILWLDDHRRLTDEHREDIPRYAEMRLNIYNWHLGFGSPPGDDEILARISDGVKGEADQQGEGGTERDEQWVLMITERIGNDENGWAVIIVGRNHAMDADGSMRRLLEEAGHRCEVTFL